MGLLQVDRNPEFLRLTNEVFQRQLESDPELNKELNEAARNKMYQDVIYNMDVLYTALELEDEKIFEYYARWLYQLLCPLMPYCSRERIKDQMLEHYALVKECLKQTAAKEKLDRIERLINKASQVTAEECENAGSSVFRAPRRYEKETRQYLECLLRSDTRGAVYLVSEYVKKGIPLTDIYVDIIAESMREVGELWHHHLITVDKEHYCTSTTQLALAQMYPIIFRQKRKNGKVLVACVGSELHEMGARMVADLFEYDGWDSIYLGAAVPTESILSSVDVYHPKLIALSVTMPQHLGLCKEAVMQIRKIHPEVKIAVGGHAFETTNEIWKKWRVDVYTQDARNLVKWANNTLQRRI
ncbi:cobalamin-dependent protein [Clostridium sp. AM58-1XD]|uniref:cobalamin B12-binding domain-containing protein n=1 Tax=Clostridium sp. AM58-1XD TaxID=2292307 RepID=UPI000E4D7449|nr:cobalamin-dependent protein [Clostridium sp. AM58-1XD]RGY98751.1 hypothetical protein DXA13_10435 [Clostridium sp. AM58-1XD]